MAQFLDAVKNRRSIYKLGPISGLMVDKVENVIKTAIKHAPSAFNSQSSRVVFLYGAHKERFFDILEEKLKAITGPEGFVKTKAKLDGFRGGVGAALFYEDQSVIKGLQEKFPGYAKMFPLWAEQGHGIAAALAWIALSDFGLGATLQHYNPLIDEQIAAEWKIPDNWVLTAQLIFGSKESEPGEKTFLDEAERYKSFS
ncbi:MAG: nitroreductase family protein [Treponema sp.]|jgi:predicted oxidoreductase (fatty acid repression mutant protein)|nr:nitroreductase family protein [Treponema sp.]